MARVSVNMWTNILLKRCVLTNVAQHNHIPCFGYALVLAINRLFTDRLIVVDTKDRTKNYCIKVMLSTQMILM